PGPALDEEADGTVPVVVDESIRMVKRLAEMEGLGGQAGEVGEAAVEKGAVLLGDERSEAERRLTEGGGGPGGHRQCVPRPGGVAVLRRGVIQREAGIDLEQGVAQTLGQVVQLSS